jgi:chromosome partitioning protein
LKIVAVASPKGGVGKTTIVLNLGFALARRGWKTLVVDGDPQGGIGLSLTGRARGTAGLAEVFREEVPASQAILPTKLAELHLVPAGHTSYLDLPRWTERLADRGLWQRFFTSLEDRYDVVLVDTPAGLSGATFGALLTSTHAISPLQAEPLALRTLPRLLEVIAAVREAGSQVSLVALVPTMVQSRNQVSMETALESFRLDPGELVLDTFIPRDPAFLYASARGVPVALLDRHPPAVAAVFTRLAAELEPRLGLRAGNVYERPIPLLD